MAGSVRVSYSRPKADEMQIKVSKHEHAYGEGGPEKNTGTEGPDDKPWMKGKKGDD